ncbi:MAG: hypothetical protein ACRDI2_18870 [Chloroflexota bacterium]
MTLDLRHTPPDKVLSRLFGALERIGADVTLLVLLRDTPEYVGVAASAYQALRARGYSSDSGRFPPGGQRLRIQRRGSVTRPADRLTAEAPAEDTYTPPPADEPADPSLAGQNDSEETVTPPADSPPLPGYDR